MNEPSATVSGTPATNPHTTAKMTAAAVTFDTLALLKIGVLSCTDIPRPPDLSIYVWFVGIVSKLKIEKILLM